MKAFPLLILISYEAFPQDVHFHIDLEDLQSREERSEQKATEHVNRILPQTTLGSEGDKFCLFCTGMLFAIAKEMDL